MVGFSNKLKLLAVGVVAVAAVCGGFNGVDATSQVATSVESDVVASELDMAAEMDMDMESRRLKKKKKTTKKKKKTTKKKTTKKATTTAPPATTAKPTPTTTTKKPDDSGTGTGTKNAILTMDCEGAANGAMPSGWSFFGQQYTVMASGGSAAGCDTSVAHSGKASLKIVGAGNGPVEALAKIPSAGSTNLYTRFYMRSSVTMGGSTSQSMNHQTLTGVRKSDSPNDGGEVRVGLVYNQIATNNAAGGNDGTSLIVQPSYSGPGLSIPAGKWTCVEVEYLRPSGGFSQVNIYVDGKVANKPTQPSDWQGGPKGDWLAGNMGTVFLGYQTYNNPATPTIYYDDFVASTTRVGC